MAHERFEAYRKRWYLANVKLDMFISILYVNIANLKSVPIEIFAEILNVFMIVRNIRQNSDVFYIYKTEINEFGTLRLETDKLLQYFLQNTSFPICALRKFSHSRYYIY